MYMYTVCHPQNFKHKNTRYMVYTVHEQCTVEEKKFTLRFHRTIILHVQCIYTMHNSTACDSFPFLFRIIRMCSFIFIDHFIFMEWSWCPELHMYRSTLYMHKLLLYATLSSICRVSSHHRVVAFELLL